MKRTALFVMELEHTSVEYANVPLTSLEESVSVPQRTCLLVEILRQAADLTTPPRHFATIVETVFVESASVTQGRMVKKLYLVITVNSITSLATDTTVNSALGLANLGS